MSLKEIENMKGATDCPDERDFRAEHILGAAEVELPSKVLIDNVPSHDQGAEWSCTGYAITHAVEIANTEEFKPLKALANPNEQFANQKIEAGPVRAAEMSTKGDTLQNALNTYIKYGLYNKNSEIFVDKYQATGFARIDKTLAEFKKRLAQGYPIYTGAAQHCFVLVGYDDALNCFIAKNSYGSTWGAKKDGRFTVDYDDFDNLFTSYIIYDMADIKYIFRDVTESSPFAEDIKACRDLGLFFGYGTGNDPTQKFFKPNSPITRAEMAAVMNRLYKKLKQ